MKYFVLILCPFFPLLSFCLSFWQFEPGVAYKSVAYKKACRLSTFINWSLGNSLETPNLNVLGVRLVRKIFFCSEFPDILDKCNRRKTTRSASNFLQVIQGGQ